MKIYETKEKEIGEEIRELERIVLLKVVDGKWMDHIDSMDELKNGIGLRAYGKIYPYAEGGDVSDDTMLRLQSLYLDNDILCYLGDKTPF